MDTCPGGARENGLPIMRKTRSGISGAAVEGTPRHRLRACRARCGDDCPSPRHARPEAAGPWIGSPARRQAERSRSAIDHTAGAALPLAAISPVGGSPRFTERAGASPEGLAYTVNALAMKSATTADGHYARLIGADAFLSDSARFVPQTPAY